MPWECVFLFSNSLAYQWPYFSNCNNVYMNIIKSDLRCHLYRTHPLFPSIKPRHFVADAFWVGNKEQSSKRTTKQTSKPTNIKNSKKKGPNRRLHAVILSWWDDIAWIESNWKCHHIRMVKNRKMHLLYTFFTTFVYSLSVFFFLFPTKKE